MTTYAKITDFASKDALLTGNPAKIVKGVEIDDEFNAIATADATSVKGPIGVTVDNTVVRWDGTTGRAVQGSGVTISDADVVTASGFTGPVGATSPNTGAFTTLSATGDNSSGNGTGQARLVANSAAASFANVSLQTNGASRWTIEKSGTESGSNAGGDLNFYRYTDAGGYLGNPLTISRATGLVTANSSLAVTGDITGSANYFIGPNKFASRISNTNYIWSGSGGLVVVDSTGGTGQVQLDTAGNLGLGVTPSASSIPTLQSAYGMVTGNVESHLSKNAYYNAGWKYTTTAPAARFSVGEGDAGYRWFTAPSGTAGNAITFTQAMTLDASGNHIVGDTVTGVTDSNSYNFRKGTGDLNVNHITGTVSGISYINFGYAGGVIGSITQNGTTAVAYNTTSDHRLKENVRPANAGRFMDIEFVDFEWVDGRHDCGVIAHQLQSVYPDLVIGEKDATEVRTVEITPAVPEIKDEEGNVITEAVPAVTEEQTFPVYQQVNYIGLIGRMGTRIQQLQRTVDAQAEMLAAMEARLAALEAA